MRPTYHAFLDDAQRLNTELIAFRRHLRRNPELSWHEKETSRFISDSLAKQHIESTNGMAVNGLYADFGTQSDQHLVAWRADIDALPIEDRIPTGYASHVHGCSHACGHDVHTTVAYGIARLLARNPELVKRPVRVFWQPAEESLPSGAPAMIADGILKNVESVMAMHCDPTRKAGSYGIRAGAETASVDTFTITVEAEATAHSARPYTGKDTVWILNQILGHLYSFGERTTDVRHPSVLSVCQISGGHAPNVIPKIVHCSGTVRTTNESQRSFFHESIAKYLEMMGTIHGVRVHLDWISGAPAVVNDVRLAAYGQQKISEILGRNAIDMGEPSLGAEDFAYYQQHVPGLFIRVGTNGGPHSAFPLHSSFFDIDESILVPTVALAATLLVESL